MEVCPPGGLETREVGRSVMTLKELVLLDEAKALLEMAVVGAGGGTTAGSVQLSLFSLPAEVGAADDDVSLVAGLGVAAAAGVVVVEVLALPPVAAIFSRCSFN